MESKHEKNVFKCENMCKRVSVKRVSLLRGVQCNLLCARQEGPEKSPA